MILLCFGVLQEGLGVRGLVCCRNLGQGITALLQDKQKLTAAVAGLSLLAFGVYGSREGTRVAGRAIDRLFRLNKTFPLVQLCESVLILSDPDSQGLIRPAPSTKSKQLALFSQLYRCGQYIGRFEALHELVLDLIQLFTNKILPD